MLHPTLFNLSYYSFLKSTLSVKDIVQFADQNRHTHVVISDFQSAYSWFEFYTLARKLAITPVFGLNVNHNLSNLLLLAKNKKGYSNLLKIVSGEEITLKNLEDIILIHVDGEECFLEHKDRYVANKRVDNGVFIRENKFLTKQDFEWFCLLRAIKNNSRIKEEIILNSAFEEDYLQNEVKKDRNSPLIKNIYKILESCEDYEIIDSSSKFLFFKNPEFTLKQIVYSNFEKHKFDSEDQKKSYKERLEQELKVIVDKSFCEYFLIVQDAVFWAKSKGICIGPGRGSACGSLLAYFLKITEIDPIKYGLYFERFLNPERLTIPDIDIDVANNRREELLLYLQEKYGKENTCLISVFQTFKVKNSIRDVSKAFEIREEEVEYCIRNLSNTNVDLSDKSKLHPDISNFFDRNPKVYEGVLRILHIPKNASVHAAGIIISSSPLPKFIPVLKNSSFLVSQWTYQDLKQFNLVKFDFLALNYLNSLTKIKDLITAKTGKEIDWREINENDSKVYETITSGKNAFIFQFENSKIRDLIKKFKPQSLLDLSLLSSIHRPGASDQIPTLLARRFSSKFMNINDLFFKFLSDTYGLLVYQEQFMKLVVFVTGCSFGEADIFRREILEKEDDCKRLFFKQGMNKFDNSKLTEIWNYISKFAKYSFNKSHSLAYAVISYRLLYLKTYYPEYFYSELLSSFSPSEEYLSEIQEAGFSFSCPSYGISKLSEFVVKENKFYFPIQKIAGLSSGFIEKYGQVNLEEKDTLSAIKSFFAAGISESDVLLLIRVGFFNKLFKVGETEYFWEKNLSVIYSAVMYVDEDNNPLFDLVLNPVEQTELVKNQYKAYRKTLLGIDLDKDRINPSFFKKFPNIFPISTITSHEQNIVRKYVGFLSSARFSKTFRDTPFLWIKLSDNFFSTPDIAYFGEDLQNIHLYTESKLPAIVSIEKKENFLKILSIKIIPSNSKNEKK